MPYCIECGAKLIPEGAVSCVACGADAYDPELEKKKAAERAAREKERAEKRRKEAKEREMDEFVAAIYGESVESIRPRREKRGRSCDEMTAEEFFA